MSKVDYVDWMGASSEEEPADLGGLFTVDKFSKREKKGHMLLQL